MKPTTDALQVTSNDKLELDGIVPVYSGTPLSSAKKVIIMLHGRGGDAESFVLLSRGVNVSGAAYLALNAERNSWFPQAVMAPIRQNEPWLSISLNIIKKVVTALTEHGFDYEQLCFLGFSQGAALALEYVARNPQKYGGVVAFTGCLIGDTLRPENYNGSLEGTSIFIGTSDIDPVIPLTRVNDSETILSAMGATVIKKVYEGMGHTVNNEELQMASVVLRSKIVA